VGDTHTHFLHVLSIMEPAQ